MVSTATDLLTIEEALALVLERVRPLEAEELPLADAAGRVLAEDARSVVDLPPFPASAMDGFALRAADVPGTLPIVARIAAGLPADAERSRPARRWGSRPAASFPRAPTPSSRSRSSRKTETCVAVPAAAVEGDNVRDRGGDLRAGDTVVVAGTRLGPGTRRRARGRRCGVACAATAHRAWSWS